jgi:hypothetical protein
MIALVLRRSFVLGGFCQNALSACWGWCRSNSHILRYECLPWLTSPETSHGRPVLCPWRERFFLRNVCICRRRHWGYHVLVAADEVICSSSIEQLPKVYIELKRPTKVADSRLELDLTKSVVRCLKAPISKQNSTCFKQ